MAHRENEKLKRFYASVRARAPNDTQPYAWLYGPDLIWLSDEYLNSKQRLAIIGQEVGEWYYDYPEFVSPNGSVSKAIAYYREFDFARGEPEYRRTPFWRFFHEVRRLAFPTEPDEHRKLLWTNLVKFVARRGGSIIWKPFAQAESAIQLQEDVLTTELEIAKPDVCIFVTGPKFDCLLTRYFPGLKFKRVHRRLDELKFARVVHKNLPRHSYRTYHPGYLSYNPKLRKQVMGVLAAELGWS